MLEEIHLSLHPRSDTSLPSLRLMDGKAHDHPKEAEKDGHVPYAETVLPAAVSPVASCGTLSILSQAAAASPPQAPWGDVLFNDR